MSARLAAVQIAGATLVRRSAAALRNEPVRVRLYGVVVLVAGYLVMKGDVKADDAKFYVALLATVLGVETARAKVTPVKAAPTRRVRKAVR